MRIPVDYLDLNFCGEVWTLASQEQPSYDGLVSALRQFTFCSFLLLYKAFLDTELIGTEMGPAGKIAVQPLCIMSKHDGVSI